MNALALCFVAVLVAVSAEPPSGYNYQRPSGGGGGGYSGGGGGGGGYSGGGGFGGGGGSFSGGGNYIMEAVGYTGSEGQNVDGQLLEKIRQIILKEESQAASSGGGGGYVNALRPQYGVPSNQYGAPSYSSRVVGVDLEGVRKAIQVAQYSQITHGPAFGGYSSGPAAQAPSGSYGSPF